MKQKHSAAFLCDGISKKKEKKNEALGIINLEYLCEVLRVNSCLPADTSVCSHNMSLWFSFTTRYLLSFIKHQVLKAALNCFLVFKYLPKRPSVIFPRMVPQKTAKRW